MSSPGRPKVYQEERQVKAIRIPRELDLQLKDVAAEYGVSVNVLINRAISDYLGRLKPLDELLPVASSSASQRTS